MFTRFQQPILSLMLQLLVAAGAMAQTVRPMTLDQVLEKARQQSLDAFRAKNMYLSSYWEFDAFRSSLLPQLGMRITPASYMRMMTKRYDYETNTETYRQQQTLYSYANLYLSKNLGLTGGTVYFDSDLSRLENFNSADPLQRNSLINYSATPVRIGWQQPLFGYNSYKWEKKIEPLKFEKAKQQYIQSVQELNVKGNDLYFNLMLAKIKLDIARNNLATTDSLYRIGQRRNDLVAIRQEELLDLELGSFNAEIALSQAEKELKKARFSLNSFLGFDENTEIEPILPPLLVGRQVDVPHAVEMAHRQNPWLTGLQQRSAEAERQLDKTTREARFNATLRASYGLNQQGERPGDAYQEPLGQQMAALEVDIPLVDWGQRRGLHQMARKNKEVVDLEVRQAIIDFEQEVALKTIDFNLQEKQVLSSARADTLARHSYQLTLKRFLAGQADVLKLNSAMKASENARISYIHSLYTFWRYFYELQQLIMCDLLSGQPLSEDFGTIISKQHRQANER